MKEAFLIRTRHSPFGIFGEFKTEGLSLVTLENQWLGNRQRISCIPVGQFRCQRFYSTKHSDTFILMNVPHRDGILFHVGNTKADTEGCILLGLFAQINRIVSSRLAFAKFLDAFKPDSEFTLKISDATSLIYRY